MRGHFVKGVYNYVIVAYTLSSNKIISDFFLNASFNKIHFFRERSSNILLCPKTQMNYKF